MCTIWIEENWISFNIIVTNSPISYYNLTHISLPNIAFTALWVPFFFRKASIYRKKVKGKAYEDLLPLILSYGPENAAWAAFSRQWSGPRARSIGACTLWFSFLFYLLLVFQFGIRIWCYLLDSSVNQLDLQQSDLIDSDLGSSFWYILIFSYVRIWFSWPNLIFLIWSYLAWLRS